MLDLCNGTVLVQFRLEVGIPLPLGVRRKKAESDEEFVERGLGSNKMRTELERHGASLDNVREVLHEKGAYLCDAFVQRRKNWGKGGEYELLTFVFGRGRPVSTGLVISFAKYAGIRYQNIAVLTTLNAGAGPLVIAARMPAPAAIMLRVVGDTEAEIYGFVVTRALSRKEREAAQVAAS